MTKIDVQSNRDFWKLIKPSLTYKGLLKNSKIMLAEKDKIVTEEKELARIFNDQGKYSRRLLWN